MTHQQLLCLPRPPLLHAAALPASAAAAVLCGLQLWMPLAAESASDDGASPAAAEASLSIMLDLLPSQLLDIAAAARASAAAAAESSTTSILLIQAYVTVADQEHRGSVHVTPATRVHGEVRLHTPSSR